AGIDGRERPPTLLTRVLVESDDSGTIAAPQTNQQVLVNEGMAGKPPAGQPEPRLFLGLAFVGALLAVLLHEILRPDYLGVAVVLSRGIETEEIAHGAERINFALVDERGAARPTRVLDRI